MSLRPSMTRSPVACSGLMYCGVPSESPVCVMRLPPGFADGERDSEIGDDRLAGLKQDVLGLEVAMNHAVRVRVVERVRDRDSDSQRFVDRQLLLALESRAQRFSLDERHDVEQQPVRLRPNRTAAADSDAEDSP